VNGTYSIQAVVNVRPKVVSQVWLIDWIVNGESGKSKVVISYSWSISTSHASLQKLTLYFYFKCEYHDNTWRYYTSETYTTTSGSGSISVEFDDLDAWYSSFDDLSDGNTHRMHIGIKAYVEAVGEYTGNSLTADSGIQDIGYFDLKYESSSSGGGGGGGGGIPPGGGDFPVSFVIAIPCTSIAVIIIILAIYVDKKIPLLRRD